METCSVVRTFQSVHETLWDTVAEKLSGLDKTNNSFHCQLILLLRFHFLSFYCIDPIGLDLLRAAT